MPTLYTYVSRGLIRSEPTDGKKRNRRYRAEDVRRLKEQRRSPNRVALHFGTPVMDSAITLIADGRFFYGGHDAIALSRSRSLEQVAELIWTGELPESSAWTTS